MQLTPTTGHIWRNVLKMSSYYARRAPAIVGMEFDSCWDGAPIISPKASAGRLAALASRIDDRFTATVGGYLSPLPLPLGFVDFA